MPIIWDDQKYQLVDEQEEYDKKRFVIARKLFVELNTSNNKQTENVIEFSEETLNEYFRKYGDIESIEMLDAKEQEENGVKKSKAYITYRSDESAYAAVLVNNSRIEYNKKCKYNVVPAHTWKQPPQQNWDVENMVLDDVYDKDYKPPIFMLNEDCFEKVFQQLDIDSLMNLLEVSKKFNTLVRDRGFSHIKSFEYVVSDDSSLLEMRRILKCIGKYINRLKFIDSYAAPFHQFFEMLGKYVGANIRHAYFEVKRFQKRNLSAIEPILGHLTSLEIRSIYNFKLDFDVFQVICPNLSKLKLRYNVKIIGSIQPWPKLKYLYIYDKGNGQNANTLRAFLQQNPQITALKLNLSPDDENELKIIATHMQNLQKLIINPSNNGCTYIPDEMFRSLKPLNNLTKLSIFGVRHRNLYAILNWLIEFPILCKLVISMGSISFEKTKRSSIQQAIITLAQKSSQLESLCLSGFGLIESTILEIFRFSSNLKEIHIHISNFEFTLKIILEIVEILKLSRSQNAIEPVKLSVYSGCITDFKKIQELDIKSYLCVRVDKICKRCKNRIFS